MGACCGKPDRKSQGYVLGGSNTSSNASAVPNAQRPGAEAGKAKPINAAASSSGGGHSLGSPSSAPQGELSASALAAQKRAEAAEKRGVQQGGGKLSQKLAQQKQQSPYAVEEEAPGRANADWN
ncbi:hypothetical protein CPC16_000520 [Podila verticillata]|nr:hypothetical protein BGZ59_002240 [Podila verticillata]KAF9375809.1 hypothetical protein CPC16_000520 [Podila verticillata]KFH71896.1 hypothetical protein MVEG_02190 [Podila verticillata NRRL 6337]